MKAQCLVFVFATAAAIKVQLGTNASAASATILNGDFESDAVSGLWKIITWQDQTNSVLLTGWSATSIGLTPVMLLQSGNNGFGNEVKRSGSSGDRFLVYNYVGTSSITQTIHHLTVGEVYEVSWYQMGRVNQAAGKPMKVSVGASIIYEESDAEAAPPNSWAQKSGTFTASSASLAITFEAKATSTDRSTYVDDIIIVPVAPAPAVGGVGATGDPHLQNVLGQRFDLMKPGKHVLINIPRGRHKNAFLRVQADAHQLGGQCADMYFQELNITGEWVEARGTGGLRFQAQGVHDEQPKWLKFGHVQVKVAHGRTLNGAKYLNFYVKHLGHSGFAVGGLLGEDDHTEAAKPSEACVHHNILLQLSSQTGHSASVSSVAEASFA